MTFAEWRRKHPFSSRLLDLLPGALIIILGVVFSVLMVSATGNKQDLTPREATLFQAISHGLGVVGSFVIGNKSARAAAQDVVRPHARSAFRRIVSLYRALGRFSDEIESRRIFLRSVGDETGKVDGAHIEAALDLLLVQVTEQIGTANDAMDDWRDLVPDEVQAIEDQASESATTASSGQGDKGTGMAS